MAFDFPASMLLLSLSLLVHSHINCDAHLQKRFQIKKIIFDMGQTNNWLGILVLLFLTNFKSRFGCLVNSISIFACACYCRCQCHEIHLSKLRVLVFNVFFVNFYGLHVFLCVFKSCCGFYKFLVFFHVFV